MKRIVLGFILLMAATQLTACALDDVPEDKRTAYSASVPDTRPEGLTPGVPTPATESY